KLPPNSKVTSNTVSQIVDGSKKLSADYTTLAPSRPIPHPPSKSTSPNSPPYTISVVSPETSQIPEQYPPSSSASPPGSTPPSPAPPHRTAPQNQTRSSRASSHD